MCKFKTLHNECDVIFNSMSKCCFVLLPGTTSDQVNVAGCPIQGITASATSGSTSIVQWTEPTATDSFGQRVVPTKTHSPGQSFVIGQPTQVTYTFVAISGAQATCSFTVTVTSKNMSFSDHLQTL